MKNINKIFKGLKLAVAVLFVIAVVILGLYKFPNQDVVMVISTDQGKIEQTLNAKDISNYYDASEMGEVAPEGVTTEIDVDYQGADQLTVSEVSFHRQFKSICVDKIPSASVQYYVTADADKLILNAGVCDKVKSLSESYVMERLIYAEIAFIVALFLWIMINALGEKLDPNNRGNHGPIYEMKRFWGEILRYREYIFYAAKADLNAEVANSYLNRLWWVLEPFFNMLVYVIVFGRIMGNSIQNYATYVFSALLMWNYFNHILNYSVKCIRNNRDIVTKIYMPKYVLLLTNMVLNFIKLLFSLLVLIVMMIIFKVQVGICILWVIPAYIVMILLSFGFGLILLHYGVFVDDLSYAVGILLTMVMFLSGIFYDVITTLTAPLNGVMLCANPVSMFVDTMRTALLSNTITNVPLIIIWFVMGILIMYIGLHTVYKNENGYVKVI